MNKYILPGTQKYLKTLYKSLVDPITRGYDVEFIGLRECGKGGLSKCFVFNEETEEFRNLYPNFHFILIDESSFEGEQYFWSSFTQQLNLNPNADSEILYNAIVKELNKRTRSDSQTIVTFMLQTQKWKFMNSDFLGRLKNIRRIHDGRIKFVLVRDSLVEHNNISYDKFNSILNTTTVHFPPYDEENIRYQIKRNRYIANIESPIKDFETYSSKIIELSGGIGGITKRLSLIKPMKISDAKTMLRDEGIYFQTVETLKDINPKYIPILKKQQFNQDLFDAGLIDSRGKVKSSLVKYAVDKELVYKTDKIPNTIKSTLSPQENSIYELLEQNKNQIVTRENIAQALWKSVHTDKYSDWAIDAIMSRIRKKLPEVKIKTIRGVGFSMLDE